QPARYADYVIFVAEVASTCNEALLIDWFLKNRADDPRVRAYLVNHYLEMFRGTLFRQCQFAEFELAANELVARGEGVTAEALSAIYRKLNEAYFGPAAVVDDEIALEWARIPHFYYNYYVYQYSTSFAASVAVSRRILEQGAPAVASYLDFLRGGCSKTPIELLRGAGVDLSTPQPVQDALYVFANLVQELDELTR
ncbi:MAG: oligoendopeptidase F, partial [Coriobacteriia bacterium]|nr:oligoendopeptidase F [Coriobacteriia bacterium]